MCSAKPWYVLLVLLCVTPGPLAFAQTAPASEDEVAQLRREVAELRALIQRLQGANAPQAAPAAPAPTQAQVDQLQQQVNALQAKASQPPPPPTAGWNGEHFFLRSADGNFTLMPVGYMDAQYAVYGNQYGAPPDSFSITRARFGFEGNYGKQLDYVLQVETISSPTVRDAYLDFKPWSFFKIMGGQFKVPFSLEVGTADTAVEFYNRSIISVLYPDAGGAFRAPGFDIHGDLSDIDLLKSFAFGGSFEHSRSKGLAGEQSFSGAMNDGTYTFFPQFHINGNVTRYNGFLSWLDGPLGVRAEYAHLRQDRDDIGSLSTGGIGMLTEPTVVGQGYYVSAIYFLTGESDPLNALPRVKHPVIGPASPGESGAPGWGAWAVKFRYSHLSGNAPGSYCDATTAPACPITPVISPGFNDSTDQFSFGVNWYLNYWVLLKTEVNEDRLKDPSVQGILPRNYFVFFETLQFRF
jgi:phosphate-selective porin